MQALLKVEAQLRAAETAADLAEAAAAGSCQSNGGVSSGTNGLTATFSGGADWHNLLGPSGMAVEACGGQGARVHRTRAAVAESSQAAERELATHQQKERDAAAVEAAASAQRDAKQRLAAAQQAAAPAAAQAAAERVQGAAARRGAVLVLKGSLDKKERSVAAKAETKR